MAENNTRAPREAPPAPTFIRLLARMTDVEVPNSEPALIDQLSQWIDWSRAVALSRSLDGALPAAQTEDSTSADEDVQADCLNTRRSLAQSIHNGVRLTFEATEAAEVNLTPFVERYSSLQRSMLSATGRLRGMLRDRLAARSGEMARLAEVDAVLEQALGAREYRWLAVVPEMLGQHVERLRQAAQPTAPEGDAPSPSSFEIGAWREVFRQDMQHLLLAELDVRFQPLDGLLAALRAR
ncbi:MAG TPA: DUF3348 domain-containing protein [Stenotrophomonas sp.]|jgi:hypothetical protein